VDNDFDSAAEEKIRVLDDLKKQKIISYVIESKTVNDFNDWPEDITEANVMLFQEKVICYVKSNWEAKKVLVEKLARYYFDVIRIIEVYFKNGQKIDDTLNKQYENLCDEIRILIYKNDLSPRLKEAYEKPFNSLFSAGKELEKSKITLKDKMDSLRDLYGDIQKLLLVYDVNDNQDNEISKIENYLDEIESKVKTAEKLKLEPSTKKIEITKIPPLKLNDPKGCSPILKTSLKSVQINYNDDEPAINVGNKKVSLPPYKNEHYLCREMFERKINESVDWSIIYEKMTGEESTDKENWRTVYDAMNALNKRIQEICNTDNSLFTWRGKMIKRNY
jgi:hypothetical protein